MTILKPRTAAKAAQPASPPLSTPPLPATSPLQSEERRALAAEIERRNNIQRELDATNKALAELHEVRCAGSAHRAVEAASEAVEAAKANAAAYMAAKIGGTAGEPPTSVKDARAALQEAEDNLETQKAIEASLKAKLEAEQEALHFAKVRVNRKVQAVVGADPSLRRLLVEYEDLRRVLAQRAQLFGFLFSMIPREFQGWQSIPCYRPGDLQDETPPWRAALAELEHNSDAPLPS
jgi:hypothetical protein